ncbi:MAG: ABC transporter permease [Chloroflexota bacterium]|nr:ABC transporter permease [Chloroflexota bacterium]
MATVTVPSLKVTRGDSPITEAIRNIRRSRSAMMGLVILTTMALIAIFAPVIAPYDPYATMIGRPDHTGRLPGKPPCIHLLGCPAEEPQHFFGLDLNGRDMFSRVVYGARVSLVVGVASIGVAVVIGTFLGLVAGYASGIVDNIIMRFMDILLAFPSLLLAIAIVTVLGPRLENALIAIAVVSIPVYARITRASVLTIKEQDYVAANYSLGAMPRRTLFLHIFPNSLTPLIVQTTLGIGGAVLETAALSFLGLGGDPRDPEWGRILSEGRQYVFTQPHLVFFPGIAIMITVLGFNLFGDGLRDALDPRLNRI